MAEERGMIIGDRVEARLDKLSEDVAEVKGELRQIDKRLSNVEGMRKDIRQLLFVVLGTWITTMVAILAKMR